MPPPRVLLHRAKARCIRIKYTSSITINSTEPTRSCANIKPYYSKSVIITEVELSPTTARSSLDSTISSTSTLVDLTLSSSIVSSEGNSSITSLGEKTASSNDDNTPLQVTCLPLPVPDSSKSTPKSCLKSTTSSPSVIARKTISWTDNYHIIGPAANERELINIHEVIRDDSEVGFTAEASEIWKVNKSIHREINNEENICTGYCGAQKIRFLREEEFRRQEAVEDAAYERWKEKAHERKRKWAERVGQIAWEEEEDGEVMAWRDNEGDEDEDHGYAEELERSETTRTGKSLNIA